MGKNAQRRDSPVGMHRNDVCVQPALCPREPLRFQLWNGSRSFLEPAGARLQIPDTSRTQSLGFINTVRLRWGTRFRIRHEVLRSPGDSEAETSMRAFRYFQSERSAQDHIVYIPSRFVQLLKVYTHPVERTLNDLSDSIRWHPLQHYRLIVAAKLTSSIRTPVIRIDRRRICCKKFIHPAHHQARRVTMKVQYDVWVAEGNACIITIKINADA